MLEKEMDRVLTTREDIDRMRGEIEESRTPEHKKKARKTAVRKAVSSGAYILVVLLLAGALCSALYAKRTGGSPDLFGWHIYRIETSSMDPTLPVGSLIVSSEPKDASALETGDIVTFITGDGNRVTHRIVEISTDAEGKIFYRTKGDNPVNSVDIAPLYPENIEAVLRFKLPLF